MMSIRRNAVLLSLLLTIPLFAGQDPHVKRGIAPGNSYSGFEIDTINNHNGNLVLRIPLPEFSVGPFLSQALQLTYNSKLYDYQFVQLGEVYRRRSLPERYSNAGFGWTVSLGKLVSPSVAMPDRGWFYRAPDGSEHDVSFWPNPAEAVTTDGSFLRVRRHPSNTALPVTHWEIEFGDGTIHKFNPAGDLTQIRDRVGHTIDVDYSNALKWVITNRYNGTTIRTTTVNFAYRTAQPPYSYANHPNFQKVVQSIEVPKFNGGTSTYVFTHVDTVVPWGGCEEPLNGDPTHVPVPMLTEVLLPEDGKYTFTYEAYGGFCAQGIVKAVKLPTMGSIEWVHNAYSRSGGQCNTETGWVVESPGVFERTVKDAQGNTVGQWQYAPWINIQAGTLVWCGSGPDQVQGAWGPAPTVETTTVTTRANGATLVGTTRHYFSGARWTPPPGYYIHEYGLPFTRSSSDGGRFLSAERSDAANVFLSKTYLTYKFDQVGTYEFWNPRVQGNRTVYNADTNCSGACFVDTDRPEADYDGYGHYRKSVTTSNFGPTRTTFTNYTPNPTTWLLGTYDSFWVEEGGAASKQLFTFDTNGLMRTRRTLVGSGSTAASISTDPKRDLLAVSCRDARGFLTSERFFGGDASTAWIPTGDPCTATPAATEYRIDHEYTFTGVVPTKHTSRYSGMPFFISDEDLDAGTGLVSTSRDVSGLATVYKYDSLGRTTEVKPTGMPWTRYEYSVPSPTTIPSVRVATRPAGSSSSATPLTDAYVYFDGLGRPVQQKTQVPSDSGVKWGTTNTIYDFAGRVKEQSVPELRLSSSFEIFTPAKKTVTTYDSLGRPISIDTPDNKTSSIAYTGAREIKKTVEIALTSGLSNWTTEETYDAYGRLTQIKEPNETVTRHSYDLGGRLSKVCQNTTNGGVTCGQTRTFGYDNRGFLMTESHPESYPVDYTYDSRGHALTKTIPTEPSSERNLKFSYDGAERLTQISTYHQPSPGSYRQGKLFTFASGDNAGANLKKGKLESATRFNYNVGTLEVKETYDYSDAAGRLWKTTTEIKKDSLVLQTLEQSQTYEPGGNPGTIIYPTCVPATSCGAGIWNTSPLTYTNGFLTGVSGFADSITYGPAGATSKVDHSGPVTDTYVPDETGVRPKSISFAGYTTFFLTGVSPRSGSSAGGTGVTLTGAGFGSNIEVLFNGSHAQNEVVLDAGRLTATTPAMPAGSLVPIQARFSSGASTPATVLFFSDFLDVPASHPRHDDIETIFRAGVTAGCSAGNYCPGSPVNRAQMAIFLLRAKFGSTYPVPPAQVPSIFSDMQTQGLQPFAPWVEELYDLGITSGCASNPLQYCPTASITHAQMAVFLLRAKEGAAYQPPPATGMFADIPTNHIFRAWMEEVARRGIWTGCGGGNYCPNDPVLRDQMATMLTRTFGLQLPPVPSAVQPSAQPWTTGNYIYDGAGNIMNIGTSSVPGSQGYRTLGYDKVSRLTKAQIGGVTPAATHEYGYDVYGNRTSYVLNGQPTSISVNPSTNRLTDATYDTSGNQISRGWSVVTYDGFNMATSYRFDAFNAGTFVYTPNDERIGVLRGTDWTWSLRGSDGKVLRQYRSSSVFPRASWGWVEDFVYGNGLLLGTERSAQQGGRRHYHLDHLGTARLVTDSSGSFLSEHDFLPFGEERTPIRQLVARGYDREEPLRFTGHERDFDIAQPNDSSAYIDYMHARYYATKTGRFLSVDPVLDVEQATRNPQGWNRYSYVRNNPLRFTDPTGRQVACANSPGDCKQPDPPKKEDEKEKPKEKKASDSEAESQAAVAASGIDMGQFYMGQAYAGLVPQGTVVAGVSGSGVSPLGVEGSFGFAANSTLASKNHLDVTGYLGGGVGHDIGVSVYLGWIPGPMSQVRGSTQNANAGVGSVSVTGVFDNQRNHIGTVVSVGPSLSPVNGTLTTGTTKCWFGCR